VTGENKPSLHSEGGFTLIEVVIAMVILSVGLLALEALGIYASRMVTRAHRESMYVASATSRLEDVAGRIRAGVSLASVPAEETLSDGAKLTWTEVANPGATTLRSVRVKVTPPAAVGERPVMRASDSLSLSVDVFLPTP